MRVLRNLSRSRLNDPESDDCNSCFLIIASVAGAGTERKRYILGPGLEYQFGTTARIWGVVEQERTNLEKNENWWRLRAGLEFYPGTFYF